MSVGNPDLAWKVGRRFRPHTASTGFRRAEAKLRRRGGKTCFSYAVFWNILPHRNILRCLLCDVKTPTEQDFRCFLQSPLESEHGEQGRLCRPGGFVAVPQAGAAGFDAAIKSAQMNGPDQT